MPQEALLSALRLSANAPAAALDLLQESHWASRQQLVQTLASVLSSGDWLALAADSESRTGRSSFALAGIAAAGCTKTAAGNHPGE